MNYALHYSDNFSFDNINNIRVSEPSIIYANKFFVTEKYIVISQVDENEKVTLSLSRLNKKEYYFNGIELKNIITTHY